MKRENGLARASLLGDQPQNIERRGEKRHVALLRVALLHAEGSRDLCVVKNVSSKGLSARAYRKFEVGNRVQVEFRSGELLSGAVIWVRDWEFGVEFPEGIDVSSVLASRWVTETGRRRNLPRIEINCIGRLTAGLQIHEVALRDISQGGARVQVSVSMPDNSPVLLSLPGLPPLAGVARWAGGAEAGISFNECLSFELLARWIQAQRTVGTDPGISAS